MAQGKYFDTLILMVLENTGWSDIQNTWFFEHFTKNGLVYTDWCAQTHPSGPNYRALMSGQTWSSNEFDGVNRPNIGQHVDYRIVDFGGVPAVRHNPFLDMNPDHVLASNHLPSDGFTEANLTDIVYLGLDDANNAHSGPLGIADAHVQVAVNSFEQFKTDRRVVFALIFDEAFGADYNSNHVFAGFLGHGVPVRTGPSPRGTTHANFARYLYDNWSVPTPVEAMSSVVWYAGQDLLNLSSPPVPSP